ncbi:hypothetical protein PTE30175_01791 [Pandoraea terrae]|uniref:Uncharacterized protein n=1 Tax=Pandoraea terrae TaxID=1537710 RepID=A0A5E4U7W9_9BURK|nr:hypothetical protein PTE30175_01791 [Pandoraea terrae]
MRGAPVRAADVTHTVREQERLQSLPGLPQIVSGSRPRTGQILKCLILDAQHVHRRQIACAQELVCRVAS